MKTKLLTLLTLLISIVTVNAQEQPADGYYRVNNYKTGRYVYICDNRGSINMATTDADLLAIELWKNKDKAISDPATVLYFTHIEKRLHEIAGQGTCIYDIIGAYANIMPSNGLYYCYGTNSGLTKYLSDGEQSDSEKGTMVIDASGDYRKWHITPITAEGDNYFGVKGEITANGKHYSTMYASFPFSTKSAGVKAYAVTKVDCGMAVISEIQGVAPGATGVLFISGSAAPDQSRLNIGGNGTKPEGNLLSGVYFDNSLTTHFNRTKYDPNTMRVLGVCSDGKPGFIKANIEYLPRNKAYLTVPAGSPAELKIVTKEEYDKAMGAMPTGVTLNTNKASMFEGETLQLTATVSPDNASDKSLRWSSSAEGIATVDQTGKITAQKAGEAVITVKTVNDKTTSCIVTVNPVYPTGIVLDKTSAAMVEGDKLKLTATLSPSVVKDGTITWSSLDNGIATVSADGTVAAVKYGSTVISATTANGLKAECNISVAPKHAVEIVLTPTQATVAEGSKVQLTATVKPDNVADKTLVWSTSSESIATVSNTGEVTGTGLGEAIITVSAPNGVKATSKITVVAPQPTSITIEPSELIILEGEISELKIKAVPANADISKITWTTGDSHVATVTSIGQVKGVVAGETKITATTPNGLKAECKVTVKEEEVPVESIILNTTSLTLKVGDEATLYGIVMPFNATNRKITWSTSNPDVAVYSDDKVKAIGKGKATITATAGKVSAVCEVTVNPQQGETVMPTAITLSSESLTLRRNETVKLTATLAPENVTEKQITWASLNSDIARVDSEGNVTAVKGGNTVISATTVNGLVATCKIKVDVKVESIKLDREEISAETGSYFILLPTITPDDATDKTLTWSTTASDIAEVDAEGKVTVKAIGRAEIRATANDGSGIYAICVVNGISGIDDILADGKKADVYNLKGIIVKREADAETVKALPAGIYIINGKKIFIGR